MKYGLPVTLVFRQVKATSLWYHVHGNVTKTVQEFIGTPYHNSLNQLKSTACDLNDMEMSYIGDIFILAK